MTNETTTDHPLPDPLPTPKCIKCGHSPCPSCGHWCDTIVSVVLCPVCEASTGKDLFDLPKRAPMHCKSCGHDWKLSASPQTEPEVCCDGECEWDQPDEVVAAWCTSPDRLEEPTGEDRGGYDANGRRLVTVFGPLTGHQLRHGETLAVEYDCDNGMVDGMRLYAQPESESRAGIKRLEHAKTEAREEGFAAGRDHGLMVGFVAAHNMSEGMDEDEALSAAMAQFDEGGVVALAGKIRSDARKKAAAALRRAVEKTEEPPAGTSGLSLEDIRKAIAEETEACNDHPNAESMRVALGALGLRLAELHARRCPDDEAQEDEQLEKQRLRGNLEKAQLAYLRFQASDPERGEQLAGADDIVVTEKDGRLVAFGVISEEPVPLIEAYREARIEADRLTFEPTAAHAKHRDWYATNASGWVRYFALACEDLDAADRGVAEQWRVPLAERNKIRRQLSCIRMHLLEAHDEMDRETGSLKEDLDRLRHFSR